MSLGHTVLRILLTVACIAAAFGAAAWRRFRRRGETSLLTFWTGTVLILGALGALRAYVVLPTLAGGARRPQAIALGGLFAVFLAIALTPPALALRYRAQRAPSTGVGAIALRSAAWSLLGVLLAIADAWTPLAFAP
jgi:hypothetical protein